MVSGSARIVRGNALALPLADASVDLCVTSPPYFGLRSYQDTCAMCRDLERNGIDPRTAYVDGWDQHARKLHHYAGQLGSEPTPAEFVDALIAATREMVRVLKPSGSIFVNLGDKYAMDDKWGGHVGPKNQASAHRTKRRTGIRSKSLMGIPWRYALRCIDTTAGVPVHIVREMVAAVYNGTLDPRACDEILKEYENGGRNAGLGLILRAEIIWAKPNGLPESVTDRVRRSHEQWFHFTREPRYFSAVDEIREGYTPAPRGKHDPGQPNGTKVALTQRAESPLVGIRQPPNPLGKLPGSVWTVPTQPLTVPPELGVDHFAAFPMELPRRIIQGWSPAGVCTVCGEGRRPLRQSEKITSRPGFNVRDQRMPGRHASGNQGREGRAGDYRVTITGYVCACIPFHWEPDIDPDDPPVKVYDWHLWDAPPTTPGVVADVFGGTGTTALVAKALGRIGISVDMSADYSRLATWRCNDPGQMAAALQVERPEPVPPDQLDLFSEVLL